MKSLKLVRRLSSILIALALLSGCATAGTVPTGAPATQSPTVAPAAPSATSAPAATATAVPTGEQRIVGYFVQWGIYDRAYLVKNVKSSGAAERMTHMNYAFSNIDGKTLTCKIGDSFADYEKGFLASESVDNVADTLDDPLRGNFHQLQKLKREYPELKIMISIGGWTWSEHFSKAALPANRAGFVSSCIDMFIKGNFTPDLQGYEGIFDGIDVDWEYPGACGRTCDDFLPEDTANFTALLAEFRSQLDALGATTGKHYPLTIAQGASVEKLKQIELGKIHAQLDFINVMAYDFHGAWDKSTGLAAPIYSDPVDPRLSENAWVDAALEAHLKAGVPAGKLVLGVPFYGRGWTGVPAGPTGDGLYQTGSGPAGGKYEAGVDDYKALVAREAGYKRFFHPQAQAFYVYNGSDWWTYENPESLAAKMAYVKSRGLGGVMFWELSGDTGGSDLLRALDDSLRKS